METEITNEAFRKAQLESWLDYVQRALKKWPMAPGLLAIMRG